ncbi:hypothetical protein Poli38472_011656 [Pythium oligandrum]|uniref:GPI transamidase subunit PIG-U n=1 Tax=Pythium oligandrum TaxID=41045 RepID=A0A8K1CJI7_PYTOL|nr:hypothetical protein Poli38472_011656 [Pythium oligandrum]|eukprot:TMW64776.1 hypothetical protein Poli38472_011656 [Pythium oligandrum]
MTKRSGATLYATLLAGAALRALLYAWGGVQSTLSARPELVTAVSSFRRVQEAVFLYETQGSPYAGDVFHQPPLVFAAFYPILSLPDKFQYAAACAFFIAVDLLIAWGLVRLCERTHELGEAQVPTHDGDEIWLNKVPMSPVFSDKHLPHTVAFIYLFNPYSLASSVAMATTSLTHLTVLYSLVFAASGALVAATLCLATATYLSVYPALLVVPVAVMLRASHPARANRSPFLAISSTVQLLVVWLAALLYLSKSLGGDWEFIEETYVWVAKYSDLTPNVGVFWYFFIEVFDRFIPYFLLVLHIHPLIYVAPMYLRLSHRPQVYACVLFGIASLFQAYPSFGDFGFFLVMMAVHPKTIMTIKYRYVYVLGLAVATCMLPVMWFLWLFPASGNANFFYNQTLVYQIFNSQVITAFVGATMKRDKDVQIFRKRLAEDAKKKSE